jgi:hypothetical protein
MGSYFSPWIVKNAVKIQADETKCNQKPNNDKWVESKKPLQLLSILLGSIIQSSKNAEDIVP